MTGKVLDIRHGGPRRGRLVDAQYIAIEIIGGDDPPSPEWVSRNVPGKIDLGHRTKRWYEDEVWTWVESCAE